MSLPCAPGGYVAQRLVEVSELGYRRFTIPGRVSRRRPRARRELPKEQLPSKVHPRLETPENAFVGVRQTKRRSRPGKDRFSNICDRSSSAAVRSGAPNDVAISFGLRRRLERDTGQ